MDTTETYTKMCEKAEEIQKCIPEGEESEFEEHQFFIGEYGIYKEDGGYYYGGGKGTFIWLPRQDQLQGMVIGKMDIWTTAITGLHNLARFAETIEFDSMEQLWLAFVMKEKYNKTWNGEKWHSVQT